MAFREICYARIPLNPPAERSRSLSSARPVSYLVSGMNFNSAKRPVAGALINARKRLGNPSWPPVVIWVPVVLVVALLLLSPVYLAIRTLGAGTDLSDVLFPVGIPAGILQILAILARTLLLVAAVSLASVAIGLPLAWLTTRSDLPLRRLWSVLTLLPLVIPSYVFAIVVVLALGPRGMLQGLLEGALGVERLPDINGFAGAWLALSLLSYPYVVLTLRAALNRLDPALEESSRGLGHSAWSTFLRVLLPLLRPAMLAGALLVGLYTLSDFGAVSLLRYETFTAVIFQQYDAGLNRTLASAFSLMLMALAMGIVVAESWSRGHSKYYRSDPGAARPASTVKLGRWRWPALIFCGLVALLSLGLPLLVLLIWIVRGVMAGEPLLLLWQPALNSVTVSLLAAVAAVVAALPLAILSVRHPGLITRLSERITHMGFALPGIAVALGLVFFGANYALWLYQTLGLLILAYVILFLPAAVGPIRASLLQVSPNVEDAARSLGSSPARLLTSITIPLVRPGILAGAALVFLLVMKELPATLILSPIGFETLAFSVWDAYGDAFFARAAAPALLLILVSSISLAFLSFGRER